MPRTYLYYALGAVFLMAIGFSAYSASERSEERPARRTISIGGTDVRVEIADTDAERAHGLSGHAPLADDEGMLFVFPEEGFYPFWMRDMAFPIDIFWIDAAGKVVHIEHALSPDTYPTTFTSGSPARYVLEVRAGFADQHDIEIGEIANLPE
jgi:uncharacterized membrane protein (UPF0127 family)